MDFALFSAHNRNGAHERLEGIQSDFLNWRNFLFLRHLISRRRNCCRSMSQISAPMTMMVMRRMKANRSTVTKTALNLNTSRRFVRRIYINAIFFNTSPTAVTSTSSFHPLICLGTIQCPYVLRVNPQLSAISEQM